MVNRVRTEIILFIPRVVECDMVMVDAVTLREVTEWYYCGDSLGMY